MRALVTYESMYGNTHIVADAIGEGLRELPGLDVVVSSIHDVDAEAIDGLDVLVVGGPTHVHGMSRPRSREAAATAVKEGSNLELDPDMAGDGVREWLTRLPAGLSMAAAFDTRIDMNPIVTGRASKGIAKELRRHGAELLVEPESFLVTKDNHLEPDERSRAIAWGTHLGTVLADHL